MKKLIKLTLFISIIMACSCKKTEKINPLLGEFDTPFQTPPFDKISDTDFLPAFEASLKEAREDIDKIKNNTEEATFENTIEALEFSGEKLNRTSTIFFSLNEAETTPKMQEDAAVISGMLTEFGNDISLNDTIFKRVKAVYDNRESLNLDNEQAMLLDKTYKSFVKSGALLSESDKETYREISKELSALSVKFSQNVLAANNGFTLNITKEEDLQGLPENYIESAKSDAQAKGLEGWAVTLHAPSYIPFMKYSEKRELREQLWKEYNSRCFKNDSIDNQSNIKRITELRLKMANLLGYKSYSDMVLVDRMAESKDAVNSFINNLLEKSLPYAKKEVKEIEEYAKKQGADFQLMPWDWSFYSEKYKDEKYNINEELTKPYFQLENVEKGMFMLAEKLWGITFNERKDIPVYNKDVKTFEVKDKDGKFLAVLYLDYFPRDTKSGGAWMTTYRDQSVKNGIETRPLISLVCNFTRPTENAPALLTFDEVETILHEFGHGLHGIMAQGKYASLTGTSVYRDFVELPSQIMENWAVEKEYLDLWATHYQTGEPIPAELVDKIIAARNYLAGYASIRQLTFGLSDMAWHSIEQPIAELSVGEFEKAAIEKAKILPVSNETSLSSAFTHIFSGGYGAGYYSYKWAEVLDADAFSLFKQNGVFDTVTAASFREHILSKGGSEHPMVLYKRFRGQEPSVEALLKRSGLQ